MNVSRIKKLRRLIETTTSANVASVPGGLLPGGEFGADMLPMTAVGKFAVVGTAIRHLDTIEAMLERIADALDSGAIDEGGEPAKRLSVAFGSARRLLDYLDASREKIQAEVRKMLSRGRMVRREGFGIPRVSIVEARGKSKRRRHLAGPERYKTARGKADTGTFVNRLDDFLDEIQDLRMWADDLQGDMSSVMVSRQDAARLVSLFDKFSEQIMRLSAQIRRAITSAGIG